MENKFQFALLTVISEKYFHESERNAIALFSSKSAVEKGGFQAALKMAMEVACNMPEGKIFMIPIRVDVCELPTGIKGLSCVDLFASDEELNKVLQVLRSDK